MESGVDMWQHQLLKARLVFGTQLGQNFTPSMRLLSKNRIRVGFIPAGDGLKKRRRGGNKRRELAVYMGEPRFIRGAGTMTLSPAPPRNGRRATRRPSGGRNVRRKEKRRDSARSQSRRG